MSTPTPDQEFEEWWDTDGGATEKDDEPPIDREREIARTAWQAAQQSSQARIAELERNVKGKGESLQSQIDRSEAQAARIAELEELNRNHKTAIGSLMRRAVELEDALRGIPHRGAAGNFLSVVAQEDHGPDCPGCIAEAALTPSSAEEEGS